MNYTTEAVIIQIEAKEYKRKEAVFLATRIHKANHFPGFEWDKAIEGFRLKFSKEVKEANILVDEQYPNSPAEEIDWLYIILYFAEQPYNKGE